MYQLTALRNIIPEYYGILVIGSILIFCNCFGPSQSHPTTQQIIFYSSRDNNHDIYSMDINGYNQVYLTRHPASDTDPIFSPDGAKIVFISNRDNPEDVFIMDLEWRGGYIRYSGINQINLSNQAGDDLHPEFSPTGIEIAFESFQIDNYEIFLEQSLKKFVEYKR